MSRTLADSHPQLASFLASHLAEETGAWGEQPPTEAEIARILAEGLEAYDETHPPTAAPGRPSACG